MSIPSHRLAALCACVALLAACSAAPVPPSGPSSTPAPATTTSSTPTAATTVTTPGATATTGSSRGTEHPAGGETTAAPTSATPTAAASCPLPATRFDCDLQRRIVSVENYIATRPGTVGIVLRDRTSGASWRDRYSDTEVWTASTIKLAMVMDLFIRDHAGSITLSAQDRVEIQEMLHSSDDDAADALWFEYSGADHMTFNRDFATRFGMTGLQPQSGFTNFYPYWGFQKCTPEDLDRLDTFLLTKLDATDRDYIVGQLQHVATDQQWGVWNAGSAAHPGNKDGWSLEASGYIANTVGFVGPGQRYTLVVMNSLDGQGTEAQGETTVGTVAKLLFSGRY